MLLDGGGYRSSGYRRGGYRNSRRRYYGKRKREAESFLGGSQVIYLTNFARKLILKVELYRYCSIHGFSYLTQVNNEGNLISGGFEIMRKSDPSDCFRRIICDISTGRVFSTFIASNLLKGISYLKKCSDTFLYIFDILNLKAKTNFPN